MNYIIAETIKITIKSKEKNYILFFLKVLKCYFR